MVNYLKGERDQSRLSRRDFLCQGSLIATGLIVGGCNLTQSNSHQNDLPINIIVGRQYSGQRQWYV